MQDWTDFKCHSETSKNETEKQNIMTMCKIMTEYGIVIRVLTAYFQLCEFSN